MSRKEIRESVHEDTSPMGCNGSRNPETAEEVKARQKRAVQALEYHAERIQALCDLILHGDGPLRLSDLD